MNPLTLKHLSQGMFFGSVVLGVLSLYEPAIHAAILALVLWEWRKP